MGSRTPRTACRRRAASHPAVSGIDRHSGRLAPPAHFVAWTSSTPVGCVPSADPWYFRPTGPPRHRAQGRPCRYIVGPYRDHFHRQAHRRSCDNRPSIPHRWSQRRLRHRAPRFCLRAGPGPLRRCQQARSHRITTSASSAPRWLVVVVLNHVCSASPRRNAEQGRRVVREENWKERSQTGWPADADAQSRSSQSPPVTLRRAEEPRWSSRAGMLGRNCTGPPAPRSWSCLREEDGKGPAMGRVRNQEHPQWKSS